MSESVLTKVSQLADRAAECLKNGNKRGYVVLEQQVHDRFPNHVQAFYSMVQSICEY